MYGNLIYLEVYYKITIIIALVIVAMTGRVIAEDVLFRDDFNSLDQWRPLEFPKIKEHTRTAV